MSSGNGHDRPPGDFRVIDFTGLAAQQREDALNQAVKDGYDFDSLTVGEPFAYLYKKK